ncbi:MAG: hypothetical protein HS115_14060 [Spirochaetales bacterium]|nr:hypothetical protein [Spirochaetales bacterium]
MHSHLTTAAAHRLFGELYRKPRPPEEQAKVDEIVSTTSDVFLRIARIEELDKKLTESRRGVEVAPAAARPGGAKARPAGAPPVKNAARKKKAKAGFLANIFGGELTRWGQTTGTIDTGIFGLNYAISGGVHALFSTPEEDMAALLRGLRFAVRYSWKNYGPPTYNTLVAALQFFTEYFNCQPRLALNKDNPDQWITDSIRLQKAYSLLILYPNYRKVLLEELPVYVDARPELKDASRDFARSIKLFARMEEGTPNLKDAFRAYYTLREKRIVNWDDIVRTELGTGKPALKKYRAPEKIAAVIVTYVNKLDQNIRDLEEEIQNIELMKKRYFTIKEGGRLDISFFQDIVRLVLNRLHVGHAVTEDSIREHLNNPYKFLHAILHDFDLNFTPLLMGSVGTIRDHSTEDVIIFKQGIFKRLAEDISVLLRSVDNLAKKNPSDYTFARLHQDLKTGGDDAVTQELVTCVRAALRLFRQFSQDLGVVLSNHSSAREMGSDPRMQRSRSVPVEDLRKEARFIPHAEREITGGSRFAGMNVEQALENMMKCVLNLLFLFRDGELSQRLNATARIKEEIARSRQELQRMQPAGTKDE